MSICGAVKTDTGKVRTKNEDSSGFFPDAAFYIVADGMGGHVGGEFASALAVETMHGVLQETQGEDLTPLTTKNGWSSVAGRRLYLAIQQANHKVFERSQQDPTLSGMGTTVAAVLFDPQESVAGICHVGDSRVYRIRNDTIERLTEDHSLVQQLLREGKIGPTDVKTFPHRHVLTQAVGVSPLIQPSVRLERPQSGDIYLLCSDGIHGVIDDEDILRIIKETSSDFEKACDTLVNLANERGGRDNSTIIVLSYDEDPTLAN